MELSDPPVREDGLCARPGCEKPRQAANAKSQVRGLEKLLAGDPFCSTECCRAFHGVAGSEDRRRRGSKPASLAKPPRDNVAEQNTQKVLDALADGKALTVDELTEAAGFASQTIRTRLKKLVAEGRVVYEGSGNYGDARRYRLAA